MGPITNAVKQSQIERFAGGLGVQALAAAPRCNRLAVGAQQITVSAASHPVPALRLDSTKPRRANPRVSNHDGLTARRQHRL
jgi:hypothetical protein